MIDHGSRRRFAVLRATATALVCALAIACSSEPASSSIPIADASPPSPEEPREIGDPYEAVDLSAMRPLPRMTWPVRPVHVTSHFGWRVDPVSGKGTRLHKGIDLRGAIGDDVLAIADGTVRFAGHDPLLGNMIVLDHGAGIESWYGHMSDLLVHDGLAVERGAAIGLVGNTGRSQAPHLHLTIKIDGEAIDPLRVLGQPPWRYDALLPDPDLDPAPDPEIEEPPATGTTP